MVWRMTLPRFQDAVDAVPASGGVVLVPEGMYRLEAVLEMRSRTVLRGVSHRQTHLVFDLNGRDEDAIEAVTYDRGDWVALKLRIQQRVFTAAGSPMAAPSHLGGLNSNRKTMKT